MTDPPALALRSRAESGDSCLEGEILRRTAARGTEKSICPSEVARALLPEGRWQALMPAIRRTAVRLAYAGRIDILRHGKPVDPDHLRGVIRLRARPTPPSDGSQNPDSPAQATPSGAQ